MDDAAWLCVCDVEGRLHDAECWTKRVRASEQSTAQGISDAQATIPVVRLMALALDVL